ncbi:MAG: polysaccharide deacetylase family protein [Balneolales bacterium]
MQRFAQKKVRRIKGLLRPKGIILMYHRIADVDNDPWHLCVKPELFKEQLEVIKRSNCVMSLQELSETVISNKSRKKAIALTFDDGYRDNFYEARKWLELYQIPATFFIACGYTGNHTEFWWDELERIFLTPGQLPESLELEQKHLRGNLGSDALLTEEGYQKYKNWSTRKPPPSKRHELYLAIWKFINACSHERQLETIQDVALWAKSQLGTRKNYLPMTKEELIQCGKSDFIEIGAHTCNHPNLSTLSKADQKREIFEGKEVLETWTQKEVKTISYPHGKYNQDTLKLTKEAGFDFAYTTQDHLANGEQSRYTLPRFQVKNWNGKEFERKLKKWLEY